MYKYHKGHCQIFFWVLINMIIELLGFIINSFDNQTENSNPVSMIWLSSHLTLPPLYPFSYQLYTSLLPTVGYLCFLYVSSSWWRLLRLSSQVDNLVFIPDFNVISRVLSMVLFLRSSCCFPTEVKTRYIPPPDEGHPWNCLHILTPWHQRTDSPPAIWNMSIVPTGEVRPVMYNTVCLGESCTTQHVCKTQIHSSVRHFHTRHHVLAVSHWKTLGANYPESQIFLNSTYFSSVGPVGSTSGVGWELRRLY
jgi:hypothetical protein